MRFHWRRALTYLGASLCIFIILVKFSLDEFEEEDSQSQRDLLVRSHSHRLSRAERARWETKIIRPDPNASIAASSPSSRSPPRPAPTAAHIPGKSTSAHLWPQTSTEDDRIVAQMNYVPVPYRDSTARSKVIYVPAGLGQTPEGRVKFREEKCPISACILTTNQSQQGSADAVLLQSGALQDGRFPKAPHQVWILWLLESPFNTVDYAHLGDRINWTATYRRDSTIVTPYEKFVSFPNASSVIHKKPSRNYAQGKTKMAAWFVSNCGAKNQRWELVEELQKHIVVDIYGACGSHICLRQDEEKCFDLLKRDYKFYLSLENSNCKDYITEKFFWNALWNDVVPVVLGAQKTDYLAAAPANSFIHIEDFASVETLAQYLQLLNSDDDLYNQYFQWKGSGHFINTKFWCRLCSMLHTVDKEGGVMWYPDVEAWWRSDGICTKGRWDDPSSLIRDWGTVY